MRSAKVIKKTAPSATAARTSVARRGAIPELIFGDLWEFDPAPETADPRIQSRYDLFIGGKFVAPKSGKYFDSINPANEKKLAEIAQRLKALTARFVSGHSNGS